MGRKITKTIALLGLITSVLICYSREGLAVASAEKLEELNLGLYQCIMDKDEKCVKDKLDFGADHNVRTVTQTTPLMFAAYFFNEEIIRLLINRGALLDLQNNEGATALILAVENDNLFAAKKLLEKDADPNLKKKNGRTALIIAMENKNHDIVSMLFSYGAIPSFEQLRLLYNLRLFVTATVSSVGKCSSSDRCKTCLQDAEGLCGGLTKLWLYSKWASENKLKEHDYGWFLKVTKDIAMWDGKSILNKSQIQYFDDFLDAATILQNPNSCYGLFVSQIDFKTLLESSLLDTNNNEIVAEYTISSTVTLEQLEGLLKEVVRGNKLVSIYMLEPINHVVGLYKQVDNYHYYDPNIPEGEFVTNSARGVAKKIFEFCFSNSVDLDNPYAIGLTVHAFRKDGCYSGFVSADPTTLSTMIPVAHELVESGTPLFINSSCSGSDYGFVHNSSFEEYPLQKEVLDDLEAVISERPLFPASFIGCVNSADYFLRKDVSVDAVLTGKKSTPLMLASHNGNFSDVRYYLEKGAQPDLQDTDGNTALIFASRMGFFDITKELLDYEANTDKKDSKGRTAAMFASNFGFVDIIEQLIAKKADLNIEADDDTTALTRAVNKDNALIIEKLIDGGADLNWLHPKNGVSLLMLASLNGFIDAVRTLLEKGAVPDLQEKNKGATALMIAAQKGYIDVVKLLLTKGADSKIKDKWGYTAIDFARHFGHIDCINALTVP